MCPYIFKVFNEPYHYICFSLEKKIEISVCRSGEVYERKHKPAKFVIKTIVKTQTNQYPYTSANPKENLKKIVQYHHARATSGHRTRPVCTRLFGVITSLFYMELL